MRSISFPFAVRTLAAALFLAAFATGAHAAAAVGNAGPVGAAPASDGNAPAPAPSGGHGGAAPAANSASGACGGGLVLETPASSGDVGDAVMEALARNADVYQGMPVRQSAMRRRRARSIRRSARRRRAAAAAATAGHAEPGRKGCAASARRANDRGSDHGLASGDRRHSQGRFTGPRGRPGDAAERDAKRRLRRRDAQRGEPVAGKSGWALSGTAVREFAPAGTAPTRRRWAPPRLWKITAVRRTVSAKGEGNSIGRAANLD